MQNDPYHATSHSSCQGQDPALWVFEEHQWAAENSGWKRNGPGVGLAVEERGWHLVMPIKPIIYKHSAKSLNVIGTRLSNSWGRLEYYLGAETKQAPHRQFSLLQRRTADWLRTEVILQKGTADPKITELTSKLNHYGEVKFLDSGRTRLSGTKIKFKLV